LLQSLRQAGTIHRVLFSRNGRWLATWSGDAALKLYDLRHHVNLQLDQDTKIRDVSFNGDSVVVVVGYSGEVAQYDAEKRRRLISWHFPLQQPYSVSADRVIDVTPFKISSDGSLIAAVGLDKIVTFRETATGRVRFALPPLDHNSIAGPRPLAFSRDNRLCAVAEGLTVRIVDLTTEQVSR
jgi:WD40 repeat protein